MEKTKTAILPISVLIMTQNEEMNIATTISSIRGYFDQIIVVDSFSTDRTLEICSAFTEVEVYSNFFEHWALQRNWMLQNCEIRNDWVFFLDADESIDFIFYSELRDKFYGKTNDIASFYLNKDLYFLGKKLKYAYSHPKIRLIFKKSGLTYHAEGAREYATSDGVSVVINQPLIHEDKRSFDHWVRKHISNAEREKQLFFDSSKLELNNNLKDIPFSLKMRKIIRYYIWNKLPFGFRPVLYFLYRYFIKLGFIDGRVGFIYCVNHALWYELLIDIKILEELRIEK